MAEPPLAAAEAALAAAVGAGVRLGAPRLLKSWQRNDVWRCAVEGGPGALPPAVIVKCFRDRDRGFDEWASLAFLTRLGLAPLLAPRFLAGAASASLFVIEDWGPGQTLDDLLRGPDPDAAESTLMALARTTAHLHAATHEDHEAFDRLRESLAPRRSTPLVAAVEDLCDASASLTGWLEALGLAAPAGLAASVKTLARSLAEPGAFITFTHGDMAPSNNHVAPAGVRLLDFEYGGVRPALYDTLLWTLFCPFPDSAIKRAEVAYRVELTSRWPAAGDEAAYRAERAGVVGWRTVKMLQWFTPAILQWDQSWAPEVTVRQALLWHLDRFAAVDQGPGLRALGEALSVLNAALTRRWAAERASMFVWRAFR
jgi:thiamine kinase-like enzyme